MIGRLEAISVCKNYADFLSETEKWNHCHFDRWVIVTSPDDEETIELCRARNLDVVTSREFDRTASNGKMNKGRAISLGLNQLVGDGWILHLDADVILPPLFRQQLDIADIDPACLYGCDRINLNSWEEWQRFQADGWLHRQNAYQLVTLFPPKPVGARVVRGKFGYTPIGFFQLWHGCHGVHSGYRYKDYPDTDSTAGHSDVKFALQWDRRDRVLLPEMWVAHLESEKPKMGANWKGRKTIRFGPAQGPNPRGTTPYSEGN